MTAEAPAREVEDPWIMSTWTLRGADAGSWPMHTHLEHCLIWSEGGTVTVEADGRFWVVAPGLGIWVPAGMPHRMTAAGGSHLSITYFHAGRSRVAWDAVTGITLTGAVRELMVLNKREAMPEERRLRLQALTVDLLVPVETASLRIRLPSDRALRRVAEEILANPADDRTAEAWAHELRMSARTLSRGFIRETGFSLTRWRILVRIRSALIDLSAGVPVSAVARGLGYSNRSAFIDVFRRTTGQTPAAYFPSFSRIPESE